MHKLCLAVGFATSTLVACAAPRPDPASESVGSALGSSAPSAAPLACPPRYTYQGGLCTPPPLGDSFGTVFGILYEPWHCPYATGNPYGNPTFNNAQILADQASFGPPGTVDWKSEPPDGYYCLTQRDDVLRKHAIELRDAGVTFIMLDSSNQPSSNPSYAVYPQEMILGPMAELLKVWSEIPGAPRVVPFVPVTSAPDPMATAMMDLLAQYPQMQFMMNGKPFFLVASNTTIPLDATVLATLAQSYAYQMMWQDGAPGFTSDEWSFMSWCSNLSGFNASQGTAACNQFITMQGGAPAHIAVSPALNAYVFSVPAQATPRYGGLTFTQEFATVYGNPTTKFATFADWNSWIAIDFCLESDGTLSTDPSQCLPNTHEFVDTYTDELSRDIEPTSGDYGDTYYRLMKACVAQFARGERCDPSSAGAVASIGFGSGLQDEVERACSYPGSTNIPGLQVGQVFGYIDGLEVVSGRALLGGWECVVGSNTPGPFQVFLGGPAGVGTLQGTYTTDLPAEAAVHAACQNDASVPNRFQVDVTDWMLTNPGQSIYVHGLNVQNMLNYFLYNSGHCTVPWPESTILSESAFQANTGRLWTQSAGGGTNTSLAMMAGTSPSVAALSGGGFAIAFQADTGHLWTVTPTGSADAGLGMMAGTSPAIAPLAGGGFEVAFQANTGELWTLASSGGANTGLGMMAGTSPSIAAVPSGGYEIAYQGANGHLWTTGSAGSGDRGLGMMAGTSPSIAVLPSGDFEIAFQANTGNLWTWSSKRGGVNHGLGMLRGTSPSIVGLTNGQVEIAFQANTGKLWTLASTGGTNTGLAMMAGTSPSVAALSGGTFQVAFQANTGHLWKLTASGGADTGLGMMTGTSPAFAATLF